MDLTKELFKLAHFDPTAEDEYGNQIIDHLILEYLAEIDLFENTPLKISSGIKDIYELDFDDEEIIAAGKRLEKEGKIKINEPSLQERDRGVECSLSIIPSEKEIIVNNNRDFKNKECEVIEKWINSLKQKHNRIKIIIDNLDAFRENWYIITGNVIRIHGVESVSILDSNSEKVLFWLNQLNDDIFYGMKRTSSVVDDFI